MKIAIIGSAPSSVKLAPYGDPSWQIWGCSPGVYYQLPRCNAFFELHRWEPGVIGRPDSQKPWFSPEYVAWLAKQPLVWIADQDAAKDLPGHKMLPWPDLVQKYGHFFFTSTIAWEMALAIEMILEFRELNPDSTEQHAIGLWGVDMSACTSPDTKVLTADLRWIRADEVKQGDKLLAFDEEPQPTGSNMPQRRWRISDVLQVDELIKPCVKLTLEDGRELVCSDDHMWLTHAEHHAQWRMAKDMVTKHHREDRPSRIIKLTNVWSEDRSWEAGYLAAAFDGEGHLSQKLRNGDNGQLRAGFAQRDNVMSDTVLSAMHARGFDLTLDGESESENGNCLKYTVKGGRVANLEFLGSIRPKRLLEKFKPDDLGMMHKAGTVAVVACEHIGEQKVIGFRTSTKTFIAEGLASHNTEEYGYQRAGCQFFCMVAADLGIEIVVPPESDLLLPPPLYGVFETNARAIKLLARQRELQGRLAGAQSRQSQAQHEAAHLNGALDDVDYQLKTWQAEGQINGTDFKRLFGERFARSGSDNVAGAATPLGEWNPPASDTHFEGTAFGHKVRDTDEGLDTTASDDAIQPLEI